MEVKSKILIPIGYFYPAENGGPALTLYWISKSLKTFNFDVSIVTTTIGINDGLITPNQWLETEAGNVIYLTTSNPNYSLRYIFFTIKNIKNYNVIVITSMFALSSLIFVMFAQFLNKKIIISPRGELDTKALIYKKRLKKIIIFVYNLLSSKNLHFHVTSEMEYAYFKKTMSSKFRVELIPNFMSLPEEVGRSVKVDYLLYIGRFHAKKSIENLIIAVSSSKIFLDSKFQLLLAGDCRNEYGDRMKKMVYKLKLQERIKFIGEITKFDKEQLYANAYVTVLPSHTENFGNVVIESLSQSTPVIASTGTPWKQLNEYGIGSWVSNKPEFIKMAIEDIIQLDSLSYQEMRGRCRPFVESEYDIRKGVYKWIEYIQSL
jgi:glycosyltransferase involved in cell wall biosynthesis